MSEAISFHYGIISYDFHTYFKLNDEEDREYALKFRESIEKEFEKELTEGSARIFRFFEKEIGPHPKEHGMFEVDTRSPSVYLKLLNYYQINHGHLSVLIHPRTNAGELIDHTKHALWLGEKQDLKLEVLS
ncbi:hypothetical protein WICMUC_002929 [Wickerhamomyces mucosus]|uniref:DOPA 4,5-dioxygenase n=1 Tax=Wickerhamomyces mucosus TaxID=1378264 RepID=A0A9P8PNE0_9ASCO|nr:hypothetical protein WICMUC_002929 [Wickerhamomyces mucosus]